MGVDLAAEVATALAARLGDGVIVSDLRPLSSGASRESWRFSANAPGEPPQPYVLQREMLSGGSGPGAPSGPLGMGFQAPLLVAAGDLGVPVPPVVAAGHMGGLQFLITGWLEGEALPPRLLRDPELAPGRA